MSDLIHRFYSSFQNMDAEGMADCYHDGIEFEDPAFGKLEGKHAGNMWRMLCSSARDLKIEFTVLEVNENGGKANWVADYTFSKTGRTVHNEISASFDFKDGKIIAHTDRFDLHKWAAQAIGIKGKILGGTSFFKKKLNHQTKALLNKFESRINEA